MRTFTLALVWLCACENDPIDQVDPLVIESEQLAPVSPSPEAWFRTEGVVEVARLTPATALAKPQALQEDLLCEHGDDRLRDSVLERRTLTGMERCSGLAWCRWGASRIASAGPAERDWLATNLASCSGRAGRQIFASPDLSNRAWWNRAYYSEGALPAHAAEPILALVELSPTPSMVESLARVKTDEHVLDRLIVLHDEAQSDQRRAIAHGLGWHADVRAWERYMRTCGLNDDVWCERVRGDRLLPGLTLEERVRSMHGQLPDLVHRFTMEFPDHRAGLVSALEACATQPEAPSAPDDPSQRDAQVASCARALGVVEPAKMHAVSKKIFAGNSAHRELVAAQRRYVGPQAQLADLQARGLLPADAAATDKVTSVATVMLHNDAAVRIDLHDGSAPYPSHLPALRRIATLAGLPEFRFDEDQQLHLAEAEMAPTKLYISRDGAGWTTTLLGVTYGTDAETSVAVINGLLAHEGADHRLLLAAGSVVLRGTPGQLKVLVHDGLVVTTGRTSADWRRLARWRVWTDEGY